MKFEAPFIKNLDMQLICNASWRHDGPPTVSLVFVSRGLSSAFVHLASFVVSRYSHLDTNKGRFKASLCCSAVSCDLFPHQWTVLDFKTESSSISRCFAAVSVRAHCDQTR